MARVETLVLLTGALMLGNPAPASAGTRAIHFEGSDVVEGAVNPCTGAMEDVIFENIKVTLREDGGQLLFSGTGDVRQGAFSGHAVTHQIVNVPDEASPTPDGGPATVDVFGSNVIMRDGSGQVINVHFVFRVTQVGKEAHGEVSIASEECVGEPS